MGTIVSHGAVLRAFNKKDGPMRMLNVNFGFMVIEEYDERYAAHREVFPLPSQEDGKRYVEGCIQWKIRKVGQP